MEMQQATETRNLPVKLSDEEIPLYQTNLQQSLVEYDNLEEEKRAFTAEKTGLMKDKRSSIRRLNQALRSGFDHRDVMCHWVPYLSKRIKELVRDDNGEVVDRENLSREEIETLRNIKIDFDNDND